MNYPGLALGCSLFQKLTAEEIVSNYKKQGLEEILALAEFILSDWMFILIVKKARKSFEGFKRVFLSIES